MAAECGTCDRTFNSWPAMWQHMRAVGHVYECQTCDQQFKYDEDCDDHMDDEDHWAPQHECEACNHRFHTQAEARQHMESRNHWRTHWCDPCERGFQNANNLRQHLHGKTHLAGSIKCPFCKRDHTTASGVAHHLETNCCPNAPSLNRETIYKLVRQMDTSGVITNKQLEWHSQGNSDYTASSGTWNGHSYECYLCHREFHSLLSLNQHLSSPRHKQKIYHCLSRACGKEFTALAALFNHLESESCGATRFNTVQRNVESMFAGRMIGF